MSAAADAANQGPYQLLDHIPLGVFVLDASFKVRFWNNCLEEWTSVPREEIVGRDVRERFPHLAAPRYSARLQGLFGGGPPALFSSQLHPHLLPAPRASGRMRALTTLAVPVPAADSTYEVLLVVQDVSDLSDAMIALRAAHGAAERLAATDPLTGIANRRHLLEAVGRAVAHAHRHQRPCTLLMIDVDNFKQVNDRHGHAAGDEVLRQLVRVLERTVRQSDVIARLGGDEFAVLLFETDRDTAFATAERLRATIAAEPVVVGAEGILVTLSIGLADVTGPGTSVDTLLKCADEALYAAKRGGRNRVVVEGGDS